MNQLNHILKLLVRLVLMLPILWLCFFNASLYYDPGFKESSAAEVKYNEDVYHQLNFLKLKLAEGAGEEMQTIFPEGFIFINVLYGLTWCELIKGQVENTDLYQEGIQEITSTIAKMDSREAKRIFPEELPLKYGAFYRGWSNYLLGKKIGLQSEEHREEGEVELFKQNCQDINEAIITSTSPYLESYKSQKWPADGVIAVASLKLSDQVFKENQYEKTLEEWLGKVKAKLDKETGLIPHAVHYRTDEAIEGARGCSQSLILNFLKDIDESFAEDQFQKYKNLFLTRRVGMPGIREYPKGTFGLGDVDSGPVIFGVGGAASIVGQRTMGRYGEWSVYKQLRNSIESFGMGINIGTEKKYLFGKLPMADAFIAWSNSIEGAEVEQVATGSWRIIAQLLSILLVLMIGFFIFKL